MQCQNKNDIVLLEQSTTMQAKIWSHLLITNHQSNVKVASNRSQAKKNSPVVSHQCDIEHPYLSAAS